MLEPTYHLMPLTLFYIDATLDVPMVSPFNAVSNYLQMIIALWFYTTVFPFVRRPLYDKKTIFFHFCTCSVAYEKSSIKEIHPLYLLQPQQKILKKKYKKKKGAVIVRILENEPWKNL